MPRPKVVGLDTPVDTQPEPTPPATLNRYQWPCWWGGAALSPTPPLVHEKLLAVRKSIGGLMAESAPGVQFKVRKATVLLDKMRTALDAHSCHAPVVRQTVNTLAPNTIPPDAKGRQMRSFTVTETVVRFCAPDGSYIDFTGSGGGGDGDDKAAGKASTYSYKDACIKAFTMPDANIDDSDDESEVGVVPPPSAALQALLATVAAAEKAELKAIVAEAKGVLQTHEQQTLGAAIRDRLAALSLGGGKGGE